MIDKQFEKEEFKKSVKENVKFLYRKTLEEATQEQIFQAVSYTVKDVIISFPPVLWILPVLQPLY